MANEARNKRIGPAPVVVAIDRLEPNPWNPNVQSDYKFEKERASIKEFGFIDPITARSGRETGPTFKKLQIIDGEHRWRAAREEGLTTVIVLDVGRMSDARAKILTDVMNNLRGENDLQKWATMIESVRATDATLLDLLPYKAAEFEALLAEAATPALDDLLHPHGDEPDHSKSRDATGKLFKKFSVSLPETAMVQAQDLLRRIKALHKLDNDAAAFAVVLDLAAGALAARRSTPPPPPVATVPKRRVTAP